MPNLLSSLNDQMITSFLFYNVLTVKGKKVHEFCILHMENEFPAVAIHVSVKINSIKFVWVALSALRGIPS